jgi:TetR/AcrR family transcriptional regulator, transcriptional repressor for nem operon
VLPQAGQLKAGLSRQASGTSILTCRRATATIWLIIQLRGRRVNPVSSETRTRIVMAAMELIWEKGYNSTSMADILQRAKVNGGSLYYFFPNKQDLLLAVLDTYSAGIEEMLLQPAWRGVSDPIERVFALLAAYRKMIVSTDCFYGCPIGSLALELHEPDQPVRERLAANFAAWTAAVERCLRAAGEWPPGADLRRLAEFVLTTMEGGVMLTRTYRDVAHFDRVVRELRQYIDMLRGRPSRSRRRSSRHRITPPRAALAKTSRRKNLK